MIKWIKQKQGRIILVSVLIMTIPIIILSLYIYLMFFPELEKTILERNKSNVILASMAIEDQLRNDIDFGRGYTSRLTLHSALIKKDRSLLLLHLKNLIDTSSNFDRVFITDSSGVQIASYPETLNTIGINFSFRDWYIGLSKNWSPYVSKFYLRSALPRRFLFSIALPIMHKDVIIGALVIQPKDDYIKNILNRSEYINMGKSISYVVDKEGNLIYHPGYTMDRVIKYTHRIPVKEVLLGMDGEVRFNDQVLHRIIISVYSPVKKWGWGVVTEEPLDILLSVIYKIEYALIIITSVMVIISVIFSYKWSKLLSTLVILEKELIGKNNQLETANDEYKQINENLLVSEEKLKLAKETAEFETHSKTRFLASMSHEIRTPMNAILGLSYLLIKTKLNPKQLDYVEKTEKSAQNLLGIINDILDFSKIEAGKFEIKKNEFNISEVLDYMINAVGLKIKEKGLELIIDRKTDIPEILIGDSLRISQILINLANNSVKFTESGEIIVKVKVFKKLEEDVILYFEVEDTGIGISREDIDNLFMPFSQIDSSTIRKYGGTGLGLSICRHLTEMMGGEIGVSSELGKGSKFYFSLTLKYIESMSVDKNKSSELKGHSVLVVENNKSSGEVISGYLREMGMAPNIVYSAADAVKEIKNNQNKYTLVLIECNLRGIDDLHCSKLLFNDPEIDPFPKIILISDYSIEEMIEKSSDISIDGFLEKPVTPSSLYDSIIFALGIQELVPEKINKNVKAPLLDFIRGARILLVEDNEINQQVARELLEYEGFYVDIAVDGKDSVDKIKNMKNNNYDLVLMDIHMPDMNGYQATGKIREIISEDELPIIAMTADAMSWVEDKVLLSGMNDYLTKPIDIEKLFNALVKWIKPGERKVFIPEGIDSFKREEKEVNIPDLQGIDTRKGLYRVMGNRGLYRKLLLQFREKNQNFIEEISSSIESGDNDTAERLAHTVKGVAANLGINSLSVLAGYVNSSIKQRELSGINLKINKMEEELKSVLQSIGTLVSGIKVEVENNPNVAIDEKVKLLLSNLKNEIETDYAMALISLEELMTYFRGSEYYKLIEAIAENLDNFDTDSAIGSINSMADALKISMEADDA
jgi:signal transduction histidine kinase/DNA-binding response OmpR family regulator/HPt (histidine-containing phosphotransfer) domain-containing protein